MPRQPGDSDCMCCPAAGEESGSSVSAASESSISQSLSSVSSSSQPFLTGCVVCIDEEYPSEILFEVSGITNGTGCTDCPTLDGAYYLPAIDECCWFLTVAGTCTLCSGGLTAYTTIIIDFITAAPGWKWRVRWSRGGTCTTSSGVLQMNWLSAMVSDPYDCLNASEDLIQNGSTNCPGTKCLNASSTAHVTAV